MCIYIYTMMLIRKMFWLCWLWFGSLFCKALNDGLFFRIALKWNRQYLIEGSWKTQIMQYSHGLNSKASGVIRYYFLVALYYHVIYLISDLPGSKQ